MDHKLTGRNPVRVLVKEGQIEKAIETFESSLSTGEPNAYDYVYLADLLTKAGKQEKAIARYEEAIATFTQLGFHHNAIALCRKILRLAPDHAESYRRMGDLFAAEEFYGDALYAYFAYLERVPEQDLQSEGIRDTVRRMAELAPRRAEFAIRLSDLLVRWSRPDEAATVLQEAMQIASRGGAPDVAADLRARLATLDPSHSASISDEEGPYGADIELESESEETYDISAEAEQDAEAPWEKSPRAEVEDPSSADETGLSAPHLALVQPGAEAEETAATQGDPVRYGEIELVADDPAQTDATGAAETEEENEPVEEDSFTTHYSRGLEQMERGELEAARQSFVAASWDEQMRPEQARLLQVAQARCLSGLGRHREAVREFLLALQRPGEDAEEAELSYLLAREYEALGETNEARKRLREVLVLRPGDSEAQARLDELERGAA